MLAVKTTMRKHIEGETGDYMLIEKEEKTGRSLTYDDSRRLLILALLIVLGIFAVYTLKHVLLLVAVVFIVGMVFNPVIACSSDGDCSVVWRSWCLF
jgi:Flp pilus assembly protein TadB